MPRNLREASVRTEAHRLNQNSRSRMPIRFRCPGCQKVLSVKEHLAGKRAPCPACKHPLQIPVPKQATQAKLEEAAVALLTGEMEEQQQEQQVQETIKFECEFCDEEIEFSVELAGKREQCPHCRNLVKVPAPKVQAKAKDWRDTGKARRLIAETLLKQDTPEGMEDAWGTMTDKGRVSKGSLEEAGALPEVVEEPVPMYVTVGRWMQRGFLALVAVAAVVGIYYWVSSYRLEELEKTSLQEAMASYKSFKEEVKEDSAKKDMSPGWAAVFHQSLSQYFQKKELARKAVGMLQNARGQIDDPTRKTPIQPDEELMLIEIGLSFLPLGGDEEQVVQKTRIGWEEIGEELGRVLRAIRSEEGRAFALRVINDQLRKINKADLAVTLTNQATTANGASLVAAEQISLLYALDREKLAPKLMAPPPENGGSIDRVRAAAYAMAHAQRGDTEKAIKIANSVASGSSRSAVHRVEALMCAAETALDHGKTAEAKEIFETANSQLKAYLKFGKVSPLLLYRQVLLATKIPGVEEPVALLDDIKHEGMRAYTELALEKARAKDGSTAIDPGKISDPNTLAYGLAWNIAAYEKTKNGNQSGILEKIRQGEPPALKPLLYAGMAVAIQESTGE